MAELETTELEGVEIFSVGKWTDSAGRTETYTRQDLLDVVGIFEETKDKVRPYLKISHKDKSRYQEDTDLPALGWVSRLYMEGNKLVADFTHVPKTLKKLALAGAYARVSSEFYNELKILGKVRKWALKAVALLGAEVPALDSLKSIAELYQAPSGEGVEVSMFDNSFSIYDASGTPEPVDDVIESERKKRMSEKKVEELQAQVSKLEASNTDLSKSVEAKDTEIAEQKKQFGDAETSRKKEDAVAHMEKAMEKGSFAPAIKDHMTAIINALAQSDTVVQFSDKDSSGLDVFKDMCEKAPVVQSFEEKLKGESDADEGGESSTEGGLNVSEEIDKKIKLYQADHPDVGYKDAMTFVFNKEPALQEALVKQNMTFQPKKDD